MNLVNMVPTITSIFNMQVTCLVRKTQLEMENRD